MLNLQTKAGISQNGRTIITNASTLLVKMDDTKEKIHPAEFQEMQTKAMCMMALALGTILVYLGESESSILTPR